MSIYCKPTNNETGTDLDARDMVLSKTKSLTLWHLPWSTAALKLQNVSKSPKGLGKQIAGNHLHRTSPGPVSDSVGLGWGPRFFISNKFSSHAAAAVPRFENCCN